LIALAQPVTVAVLEEYTRGNAEPLARNIEQSVPDWPANTRRAYHSVSRGWVLAELVRRVDPSHRLMHDFVHEEIVQPLGIDLYLGVPETKLGNIVPLIRTPTPWMLGIPYIVTLFSYHYFPFFTLV
jgi:Beta-lactamase